MFIYDNIHPIQWFYLRLKPYSYIMTIENLLFNTQRKKMYDSSKPFIDKLIQSKDIDSLYITGGFITDKEKPADIDLFVVFKQNIPIKNISSLINASPPTIDFRQVSIKTDDNVCSIYNNKIEDKKYCSPLSHEIDVLEDFMEDIYGKKYKLVKLK